MMTPFESAVRGSLEGSRGGRIHVHHQDDLRHRATPLSGTQLRALIATRACRDGRVVADVAERRSVTGQRSRRAAGTKGSLHDDHLRPTRGGVGRSAALCPRQCKLDAMGASTYP